MSNMEQQFRTAMFGGFEKQDVLNYIDSASRDQRIREEALKKELEEEKKAHAALQKEWDDINAQRDQLEGGLKGAATTQSEMRAELAEMKTRLDAMEAECSTLRARLAKAEPAAEAYEAVKERTAGIELEAHHRAHEAEDAARARVKQTQDELEIWLARVHGWYDSLRTDIAASSSHAAGELTRLVGLVEQLSATFDGQDEALESFICRCRERNDPPPPQPLPLDGN